MRGAQNTGRRFTTSRDGSRDRGRSFREGLDAREIVACEAGDCVERDGLVAQTAALQI
ncbi:MAG: hypothetical protein ACI93G_000082 [Hyphomonas sp.]|jgi:hypothetical protein